MAIKSKKIKGRSAIRTHKWSSLAAQGLTDAKEAVTYLEEAFNDGPQSFLLALGNVVRAQAKTAKLSSKSGLDSLSLEKIFAGGRQTSLSFIMAILTNLEIKVHFQVRNPKRKSLSNTLVTSAKKLKMSKTTIDKLSALTKGQSKAYGEKGSNQKSLKRRTW